MASIAKITDIESPEAAQPQDLIVILDESGSMSSMGSEPVQAVNAFIEEQKKVLGDDGATFSLWKFNCAVTKLVDDESLQDVGEFTEFRPNGMTALYDAIGQAITTKQQKGKHDNVVCVILTDGQENSSKEFTAAMIRRMTTKMEKEHNWQFIYLGANQDSFASGGTLGVTKCANFECAPGELAALTRHTSEAIAQYRSVTSTLAPGQRVDLKFHSAPVNSVKRSKTDWMNLPSVAGAGFGVASPL